MVERSRLGGSKAARRDQPSSQPKSGRKMQRKGIAGTDSYQRTLARDCNGRPHRDILFPVLLLHLSRSKSRTYLHRNHTALGLPAAIQSRQAMCGRFSLSTDTGKVAKAFQLDDVPLFRPRYNIAPSEPIPCVSVARESGQRTFGHRQWGLVPIWAKDPSIGYRMINARSETVAEKPVYRHAFKRRRCLVIADGFYEWQKMGKRKQPHFIHLKSKDPFGFAGLYEHWQDQNGNELDTCSILTCPANELMVTLHDRMPVILSSDHHDVWLDPQNQDTDMLVSLLRPYPAEQMVEHAVSTFVNRPSNDDARCVQPVERETLF